jgi:hypothetical protein
MMPNAGGRTRNTNKFNELAASVPAISSHRSNLQEWSEYKNHQQIPHGTVEMNMTTGENSTHESSMHNKSQQAIGLASVGLSRGESGASLHGITLSGTKGLVKRQDDGLIKLMPM